jgi:hypothetical protein
MDKLIENIKKFEERNNVSAIVVVYSDGSNEVKEFWDSENFASFDNTKKLLEYLERATYKMSENRRMISPSKLVCSVCKSEKPCAGINNIEPCFLIDEERKFLADTEQAYYLQHKDRSWR